MDTLELNSGWRPEFVIEPHMEVAEYDIGKIVKNT